MHFQQPQNKIRGKIRAEIFSAAARPPRGFFCPQLLWITLCIRW